MCGILLSLSGTDSILNSISHRGIERNTLERDGVFLTHHRLPIQTEAGDGWKQPLEISPGIFLMYNGEIFNYDKSLYTSDIDYLSRLFGTWTGGDFQMFCAIFLARIQNWDGFWSIVIYDSKQKNIICFTDPLGKKCLYKNEDGELSSEIKPLVTEFSPLDVSYLSSVKKFGYVPNGDTPYRNVKRLLPNTIYSYSLQSPDFVTVFPHYYRFLNFPLAELSNASYDEHMEWLWNKLFESVQNRLLSKNYPISLLVSGGLDSSIIAGILSELKASTTWFSIENGEREYVDLLSKHLGQEVLFLDYEVQNEKTSEIYARWNEGPIDLGSVIPQYYLFESIKKFGQHRIVLSGDGADELFGGYSRILDYDSQQSDVFQELSFYHLPRLDKLSMAHTLELRNPFLHLDLVRFALHLPLEWRTGKKILKDTFGPLLPSAIIDRPKEALKNPLIKQDKIKYRLWVADLFENNHI